MYGIDGAGHAPSLYTVLGDIDMCGSCEKRMDGKRLQQTTAQSKPDLPLYFVG